MPGTPQPAPQLSPNLELQETLYLHRTDSSILAWLPKTQFNLSLPIPHLEKLSPSETTNQPIEEKETLADTLPRIYFHRLNQQNIHNLWSVYNSSNNNAQQDMAHIKQKIEKEIEIGPTRIFSNINSMLTHIVQAIQLGYTPLEIMDLETMDKCREKIETTIQFYYLLLFLGKYICVDYPFLKQIPISTRLKLVEAIQKHLTFENLLKKLLKNPLDLKNIYEKYNQTGSTKSGIDQITKLLELPIGLGERNNVFEAVQGTFHLFSVREPIYGDKYLFAKESLTHFKNTGNTWSIQNLLCDLFLNKPSLEFLADLQASAKLSIQFFETLLNITTKLMTQDSNDIAYQTQHARFIKNPTPLAFLYTNRSTIQQVSNSPSPYCVNQTLRLGIDIKILVTDTPENRLLLENYLAEQYLDTISVITFNQLNDLTENKLTLADISQHYLNTHKPTLYLNRLNHYLSWYNRLSFFHHHHNRALALKLGLEQCNSDIHHMRALIKNQRSLMELNETPLEQETASLYLTERWYKTLQNKPRNFFWRNKSEYYQILLDLEKELDKKSTILSR